MRFFSSLALFGNLLIDPVTTWEKLSLKEESISDLLYKFLSIIVFCSSLFAFTGVFIQTSNIVRSIVQFIIVFFSMMIGIYFAAKLLVITAPNFMNRVQIRRIFQWTIYSASVFVLFHGLSQLFTPYSFLNQLCLFLELYFIRLLWIGLKQVLAVSENKRLGYMFLAGMFILVLPLICERILLVVFQYFQ
ncbi:YIP1 family protein [Ancylomarina sp.]|uniref:YIP1 family protein n=1 Tax=Ancylomarina sp. TaxID=1970196 RepID=UPI00356884B7